MNQGSIVTVLIGVLILSGGLAMIIGHGQEHDRSYTQVDDLVCGRQLMTQQERAEYRAAMSVAQSVEERLRIRNQYHELMTDRAMARGVLLPADPPVSGAVMAPSGGDMESGLGNTGPEQRSRPRIWRI